MPKKREQFFLEDQLIIYAGWQIYSTAYVRKNLLFLNIPWAMNKSAKERSEEKNKGGREREREGKTEICKHEIKDHENCSLCSYASQIMLKDQKAEL